MIAWILGAVAISAITYLWVIGRRGAEAIVVEHYQLALDGLPAEMAGLKIMHLSDLHLYGQSSLSDKIIAQASELNPDLIALTGDSANTPQGVIAACQLLETLASRWPTYVVLGNSEHRLRDTDSLITQFRATGAKVLINETAPVTRQETRLCRIVGVDDPHTERDDLSAALAQVPEDEFVIVIAHSPDIALRSGIERVDLVLCGHTHGGQILFPGLGALYARSRLGRRFASGLHQVSGTTVFINRGLGTAKFTIRLGCPPQIAVLILGEGGCRH